jgi:hypothetical protein
MSKQHTKETVNFNNFSHYYYGGMSANNGYGGFDWIDVDYLNATYWQKVATNWCDTGYQNVIHGSGEAYTYGVDGFPSVSYLVSANPKVSFSLTSMVAASAWETDQPFTLESFAYKDGAVVLKASDTIYLSQTAQTIDFAKISGGKPTDFKNIVALEIVSGTGKFGNTCSYGPYGYTTGNEMAFDNLKVKWNGKIPQGHEGKTITPGLFAHRHHHAPYVAAQLLHHGDIDAGTHNGSTSAAHHQNGDYHTQLLSLGQDSGLTSQFALPQVEHFGT